MPYRVRLLGPLETFAADGSPVDPPAGGQPFRTLVALALRPGTERSEVFLKQLLWERTDYTPDLAPIMSRVRAWAPMPKQASGARTYKTLLQRSEVDASDFIDRVGSTAFLSSEEADSLLGMWRGDPATLYNFLDPSEFNSLARARADLIAQLSTWSRTELGKLANLETFRLLFEAECQNLPLGDRPRAKRLLVVDDDSVLTDMLAELLRGYHCLPAHTLGDAMDLVTDPSVTLEGALVDLHLTKHLDSQGLEILDALREHRPDVPRVLLTSSPMADGMAYVTSQYGLYEILVKNGNDAPTRTRRTVDKMMSDSDESAMLRAHATLDTLSSSVLQAIQRRAVTVRQSMRRNEATADDLTIVIEEMEAVQRSIDETKDSLRNTTDPITATTTVDAFRARWVGLLTTRVTHG